MDIRFNTDALKPMADWLIYRKNTGMRDEKRLREILMMPDYTVEFERYGIPELPVCGIGFEEAVDFFMNFDRKEFENPRLEYKKKSFLDFYENIEERLKSIGRFTDFTEEDCRLIEVLLANGLPSDCLDKTPELNIILIISIGNSMGWPYDHYIDYDIANMSVFENKVDFLHLTAHEIHHIFTGGLLFPEGIAGDDYFLQNFAYEGLAVHYNNNFGTKGKPRKYSDRSYVMDAEDMEYYQQNFDRFFTMIRDDYRALKGKSPEEAGKVISTKYEQFEFMGKKIRQYPTYYFGCYMWGLVDLAFGKEKVFEAISNPPLFVELYNQAADEKYRL